MIERLSQEELLPVANLEKLRDIERALEKTYRRSEELIRDRHAAKPYHFIDHTIGPDERGGVRGAAIYILDTMGATMPTLMEKAGLEFSIFKTGMYGGITHHDGIVDLKAQVVDDNGMVVRDRDWERVDGTRGNEGKSYLEYRHLFLMAYTEGVIDESMSEEDVELLHKKMIDPQSEQYDPTYRIHMQAAEDAIAGTDPNLMNFGYEVDASSPALKEFDSETLSLLTQKTEDGTEVVKVLMIDSGFSKDTLAGMVGGTADLSVTAFKPGLSIKTSNEEFWELNYGITKDCVDYSKLTKGRAKDVLAKMAGWRKTQVGVAVGQKVRFEQNFTVENIQALINNQFGVLVPDHEVEDYLHQLKRRMNKFSVSAEVAVRNYQAFNEQFAEKIGNDDDVGLSVEEIALMRDAIGYMQGDFDDLEDYVESVQEEINNS